MTLDTRRPSAALDTSTHHEAWTQGDEQRRTVRAVTACRDYDVPVLQSLVAGYMKERDAPSPHTIVAYAAGVARFVSWAQQAGVNVRKPDRNAGTRYRAHLQDAYGTPGSVNTRLSGAKALYAALDWLGVDHLNPFTHVRGVRDGRAPERVRARYTDAELAALLNAAQDATDRCIILLGAHAGLRLAEMRGLVWEGIRLPARDAIGAWQGAGEADIRGKGARDDTVPLGDALMDALCTMPEPHAGFVLPGRKADQPMSASGVRNRVALMAARAGLLNGGQPVTDPHEASERARAKRPRRHDGTVLALGTHRLRHSFGTRVYEACGLGTAQAALRHRSPTTTARYVKNRDERVAAFVRTLHTDA